MYFGIRPRDSPSGCRGGIKLCFLVWPSFLWYGNFGLGETPPPVGRKIPKKIVKKTVFLWKKSFGLGEFFYASPETCFGGFRMIFNGFRRTKSRFTTRWWVWHCDSSPFPRFCKKTNMCHFFVHPFLTIVSGVSNLKAHCHKLCLKLMFGARFTEKCWLRFYVVFVRCYKINFTDQALQNLKI